VITLTAAFAQQLEAPLDGPHRVCQDALLANMTGAWNMEGTIRGKPAQHAVDAQWVLNHQFLQIHEIDTASSKPGYEAIVMIGYDNASDRYVAHWTDIYGGRFSETLGYGYRSGEEIEFVFEYPDGPFHTTFRWLPGMKSWQWQMQTKDQAGRWSDFASLTLRSRK
jgi:hypothetical protein